MAVVTYPASFAIMSDGSAGAMHHNQHLTLQKYLLLQEQHQTLRQQIDQLRPLDAVASSLSPLTSSPSPTYSEYSSVSLQSSPYSSRSPSVTRNRSDSHGRRSSLPPQSRPTCSFGNGTGTRTSLCLQTVPDESTLQELADDEARLFDVNEGIKRALTELLNCESVRHDRPFRTWIQCRLMETEKELRVGRRRRSSPAFVY